jgi:predicted nucleic acid-binding Zn ribbon protein
VAGNENPSAAWIIAVEFRAPLCYGGDVNQSFPYRHFRPAAPAPTPRQRALAQWRRWDWSATERGRQPSARPAADIMPRVLAGLRIDSRQAEAEILKVWNHQLDPNIVAHAQPTGIRKGTLFVTVDSSVWLDEIVRYRRREILERLQNSFGRDLITRISFRTG